MTSDHLSKAQRSANMARIKGKDTLPELAVRSALHQRGFRFRLHLKELPGKPDIVLRKFSSVIFVNGCFWHQHICCIGRYPKTNEAFWKEKLSKNVERDKRNRDILRKLGWRVFDVWECELKTAKFEKSIDELCWRIRIGP
ncbi:DNA mismatch endonuclease Vsr [uncultured Sneathiella sp.]|jgi:DNA mismatch endonuclease (patch repair protein)|uniref:very short patch repair endonuclease n=1 Tax=uncultured Sneathiella sp. TaxID=879315 RepID=UPI0030D90771|tara:strand:- start:57008 stop:57430 length:423 start_codon:yes stop_codon:yes gene_type:complete